MKKDPFYRLTANADSAFLQTVAQVAEDAEKMIDYLKKYGTILSKESPADKWTFKKRWCR